MTLTEAFTQVHERAQHFGYYASHILNVNLPDYVVEELETFVSGEYESLSLYAERPRTVAGAVASYLAYLGHNVIETEGTQYTPWLPNMSASRRQCAIHVDDKLVSVEWQNHHHA